MAIGQPEPETIDIIDWHALYNHTDTDEQPIIEDLAFRGRWTAVAAAAKAGKSTVLLALAVDTATAGHTTVYLDAEMGRGDVLERVEDWMDLKPADLANLHYTDLPPKLDTVQGAQRLYNTACTLKADLVVIDGLNGVVNGSENDDTTWRDMYEFAIHPLKARGIAVISTDNMGHGERKGPRGSSVKLDKADAIIALERTETGVKLTATHRRSAAYPTVQEYTVTDADETGPPMKVIRVGAGTGAPAGTKHIIALLDELDAPVDISRRAARQLLKDNGHEAPRNAELGAMLKWRRQEAVQFTIAGSGRPASKDVVSVIGPSNHRLAATGPEPLPPVTSGPPRTDESPPPRLGLENSDSTIQLDGRARTDAVDGRRVNPFNVHTSTLHEDQQRDQPETTGTVHHLLGPNIGDHSEETPGRSVVPDRGSTQGPPLFGTSKKTGTTPPPKQEYEEPF